jgi:hypothetical protein
MQYGATMIGPSSGSLAHNQHRVSGDQQDSVDSAGQLGPSACNLDGFAGLELELLNNRSCHYDVFG